MRVILLHHYIMPHTKKKKSEIKALMELIKEGGKAEVTAREEENVSMWSVYWNTASEVKKHRKQPEEGKHQGGYFVPLRKEEIVT